MKITVCRCPVCGSANISSIAWVDPNLVCNGMMLLHKDNVSWADRDESVWCDDCSNGSDYWDEVELEGDVIDGKVYVKETDESLVTIKDWCKSHQYEDYCEQEEE